MPLLCHDCAVPWPCRAVPWPCHAVAMPWATSRQCHAGAMPCHASAVAVLCPVPGHVVPLLWPCCATGVLWLCRGHAISMRCHSHAVPMTCRGCGRAHMGAPCTAGVSLSAPQVPLCHGPLLSHISSRDFFLLLGNSNTHRDAVLPRQADLNSAGSCQPLHLKHLLKWRRADLTVVYPRVNPKRAR